MTNTTLSALQRSLQGAALFSALLLASPVQAQQASDEAAERLADLEQVAGDQTGILQLNQSAADGTQQSNSVAVSAVTNNGAAIADATSSQQSSNNQFSIQSAGTTADVNMSNVAGNSNGIIAINQSGAVGSAQSNNMAIAAANGLESAAFASADSITGNHTLNDVTGQAIITALTSGGAAMLNVGSGSSGIIAINQSAGIGGGQTNLIAIASAPDGIANAMVTSANKSRSAQTDFSGAVAGPVSISDSFNNSAGLVQLNQSSGGNNNQSNILAIAIGQFGDATAITDAGLSEVTPQSDQLAAVPVAQQGSTDVTGSFDGFTGIAQVAQASGFGNTIANTMAITVSHLPGPGL